MTVRWRVFVLMLATALPGLAWAGDEPCRGSDPQDAAKLVAWQRDCLPRLSNRELSTQLFSLQGASAQAQPLRQVLFEALRTRGAVSDSDWRSLLAGHISAGDWRAAARLLTDPLAAKALGQRRLPSEVTADPTLSGRASAWAFDFEKQSLRQEALNIEQGPRVVFQFATGCPFCPRAAQSIQADERLARLFQRCGAVLTPVDGNFDMDDFARWQRKLPASKALLVTDWSWLEGGAPNTFPTLMFMKDGKLVETVRGWPKEGRTDELLQALKKLDPAGRCSA